MSQYQPSITSANGERQFACSPVAVLVFIVNDQERVLLLAHPKRGGAWQVIAGALEANETLLDAALRETREEAGPKMQVRPLGTVHISTCHYDEQVSYLLSVGYLMAYEGGEVEPGDDMAGSQYRWWSVEELAADQVRLIVPQDGKWQVRRAVELHRLWREQHVELQPRLSVPSAVKLK